MEVLHVLLNQVAGCDVCATAKPPLPRDAIPVLRLKVPIKMSSKCVMARGEEGHTPGLVLVLQSLWVSGGSPACKHACGVCVCVQ
eukprot:1149127-Pelagomonas_calceolata.AAC.3